MCVSHDAGVQKLKIYFVLLLKQTATSPMHYHNNNNNNKAKHKTLDTNTASYPKIRDFREQ